MADIVPQATFSAGEWSPNLFARVDLSKYRNGAALLENFFVDYRGGASTRMGTKYVLKCKGGGTGQVRLIRFQAATFIGYAMEFGQEYIRFYFDGAPIVETGVAITAITQANPAVVTVPGHAYSVNDWIFIQGVGGMTELNGRYFIITHIAGNNLTIEDLNGVPVNSTGYPAYTTGGTSARVYTLASPYQAGDLETLNFTQVTSNLFIVHPSYVPYELSLISSTDWTLNPIVFGSTATPPTNLTISSTLGFGGASYSYMVTSIDANGQESAPSAVKTLFAKTDIRETAGTNQISWTASPTAVGYNVYESSLNYFDVQVQGAAFGFIGTCTGTTFVDSNIGPNFAESPPVPQNPFAGSGVQFVTVTAPGAYTTVPTVSFSGGSPSIPATAIASLGATATPTITAGGTSFAIGDVVSFGNGLVLQVTAISAGVITAWTISNPGSITSGSTPSNPIAQISTSGTGTGATATVAWGVLQVLVLTNGAGYGTTPTVVFSAGAATATATLGATSNGNPSVASFFQQRLVLAAPNGAPQTFYMSQPGSYFNFNITDPTQADNAITETLVSGTLENIQSIVSSTSGMLVLTDQNTWLINGGQSGTAVSPLAIVANRQSAIGANKMPPIVANYDVLFWDSTGFAVRDLTYNIYFNVFTGSDISITSSHLFFGYSGKEWAWARAPFYVVWAIRSDGTMLNLTFLKEQEFVGWTHSVTQGTFESVCSVTETTSDSGNVDAVYVVVERTVNGAPVQYVERVADRAFPNGLSSAWCVDCGLQYNGAPALSFTGGEQLWGLSVTGLATDNLGNVTIITPFTMPETGFFTLPAPTPVGATGYTTVTVGLAYTCKLQTLAIDAGQPPIQGKLKKIPYVDVRVNDTIGLEIGSSFNNLVPMKDLVQGAIPSMAVGLDVGMQLVNGLYSGDARTFLDPTFNVYGQYCIRQSNPYPATVLGVFPCLVMGDSD